jgi:antitoxin component HigA of HigAB toxin-antitoxin module
LERVVGSAPRASEMRNRKRAMIMDMANKIHKACGIPTYAGNAAYLKLD